MNLEDFLYNLKTGSLISTTKKLKWYVGKDGYYRTKINGNPHKKHLLIHDLLGIDRTGLTVVHLDENKFNNCADNLALMTRGECNKFHFEKRQRQKSHS